MTVLLLSFLLLAPAQAHPGRSNPEARMARAEARRQRREDRRNRREARREAREIRRWQR
jgi:hypothetical protein